MGNPTKYGKNFGATMLDWYQENKRDLPWNKSNDPYVIWVSEIILQQTRVEQGLPYFIRFIEKFPSVKHLALANEEEVLKLWQGLGYYSRARNLHKAAKQILQEHGGKLPKTKKELQTLSGIGDYTSSAIASFAYGEDHVAIDGNIIRVLTRVFGIDDAVETSAVKKQIAVRAENELPKGRSADFNRALMDFGSKVCTPKTPECVFCPFRGKCFAYLQDRVDSIPAKGKRIIKKDRYFHFLWLLNDEGSAFFERRKKKDIWLGLYQLPLIERKDDKKLKVEEIKSCLIERGLMAKSLKIKERTEVRKHLLTHQNIFYQIYEVTGNWGDNESLNWASKQTAKSMAFPKPLERVLNNWISR